MMSTNIDNSSNFIKIEKTWADMSSDEEGSNDEI
jgi:hypothetical protein